MSYLGVQDRFQIQMRSMEEFIEKENAVRFVDAFVEQLELEKVNGEMALIMTVYNMKRAINILGIEKLLKKTGSIGHVLVRNHALSNGLVDSKLHLYEGKKIKDQSM